MPETAAATPTPTAEAVFSGARRDALMSMLRDELVVLATQQGHDVTSRMTKPILADLLMEKQPGSMFLPTAVAGTDLEVLDVDQAFLEGMEIHPGMDADLQRVASKVLLGFIDVTSTAMGKGTYYNTKDEQALVETQAHEAMKGLDRGVYALALCMGSATDRSRQLGVTHLLSHAQGSSVLEWADEQAVLQVLVSSLRITRQLKLFGLLAATKVNNARARKLILRTLLSVPSTKLEWWAVSYRQKMAVALTHALGQKTVSWIRNNDLADDTTLKNRDLRRFFPAGTSSADKWQSLRFIFGHEEGHTQALLVKYIRAKREGLEHGEGLPPDVLEGIRSAFWPDSPKAAVLELSKDAMTPGAAIRSQRSATEANVEVAVDWRKYDPIKLYTYAFEQGPNEDIGSVLTAKAQKTARNFGFHWPTLGIVVDNSISMRGSGQQKNRPMATVLSIRDVLANSTGCAFVEFTRNSHTNHWMVRPGGDTSLAKALIRVLHHKPSAVFVLTDGYENAPAGRFAEVVEKVRAMGTHTPIYQVTPTMAAESGGIRTLSDDVPALPAMNAAGLSSALLRPMITTDLLGAIAELKRRALAA